MNRLCWLVALLLGLAGPAAADDLAALLDGGHLTVASRLEPDTGLVPGQRARLIVKLATDTWFTGGTRIRLPEVPGLVIVQSEEFATNASEVRRGKTWVTQSWTVDVYPQGHGEFTLPPLVLSVAVNDGESGSITGELRSPALSFSVAIPPALAQADFWVASPAFSVTQEIDRDKLQLRPGDAFERRIEFRGEDVAAMMLPEVSPQRLPGLAAYPAPPQLQDSNNRGQALARRIESISYVAEAPGNYTLPAEEFFWWNTRSRELEVLSIPALAVEVLGEPAGAADEGGAARWWPTRDTLVGILPGLAVLALLALLALALHRWRPWRHLPAVSARLAVARERLRALRRPALPQRLNPDSSAAD